MVNVFSRFERAFDSKRTNSPPKSSLARYFCNESTPKKSKRIVAVTSSGRMPKIRGLSWENKRFKTSVHDRRAAFHECFSGQRRDDSKTEIKKKAASWLKSIYWARKSSYEIIKALEGSSNLCCLIWS